MSPRFSKKVFELAAGFLRIPNSPNPLDNTGVHPENYPIIEKFAQQFGKEIKDLTGSGVELLRKESAFRELVGRFTFDDIIKELEKPGRDPRQNFVPFQYREDIHEVKDLKAGMLCPGIVTNVTNFGAFVDIGVHQDGLVHISQLSEKFVKDPNEVVNPGDRVKVRVLEVNVDKNQISLSMKNTVEKTKSAATPSAGHRPPIALRTPRDKGQNNKGQVAATPSLTVKPVIQAKRPPLPQPHSNGQNHVQPRTTSTEETSGSIQ